MKPLFLVGIVLVILGIAALAYNVIPIHHTEQIAKIGPITANQDKEDDIVVPPYAAIIALLAGAGLIFAGRRT